MRVPVLVVLALAAGACKKDKDKAAPPAAAPPASTTAQDALWSLAPDGAVLGVVISPQGLERLEAGMLEIDKVLASPDLAAFKANVDEEISEVLGTSTPSLAAAGMSASKGLAMFVVPNEPPIAVLPVTDRDKFLAVAKGQKGSDADTIKRATCKTVKNVYACARTAALLDRLGKGNLTEQLKLAGARGDVELAAAIPGPNIKVGAVAQLARGTAVVRAGATGMPADVKAFIANSKPRVDGDKTAGFALVNIGPIINKLAGNVPAQPIVSGVTTDELAKTITGPLTMTIGNAATTFDIRVPLSDGGPTQKLLEQCDKLPPAAMLGVTVKDGVCHIPLPQMQMELDAWVDGKTLRIGKKGAQDQSPALPMPAVGKELASGEWALAAYGRGTLFAPTQMALPFPPGQLPPEAMLGIRAMAMLNEAGFGVRLDGDVVRVLATVRTAWANPDDVVAKLVAIAPEQIIQGKASAAAKSIAEGSPKSPFAGDYAAGYGGLMVPTAAIGMLAAIAIPAFMDYTRKSKVSEAQLELNRIAKGAKLAYIQNGEFPKGTVAPAPSCCASGGKCPPGTWDDPVWKALVFEMDTPHLYRYSYSSADGKSFVAKATGDLDCDGVEVEYVATGTIDNGNPVVTITEPPPSSD